MRRAVFVAAALAFISAHSALATMPTLTDKPKVPSEAACGEWASNQDEDAISIWGIQEDGTTSHSSAVSRLTASCLGFGVPEIVGFGSSAGFDEAYCDKHPDFKICGTLRGRPPAASCVVDDPTPTMLNLRTAPYGRIIGQIDNGRSVVVIDTATDQYGKPWVYVADQKGTPLGWVYRAYVLCRR